MGFPDSATWSVDEMLEFAGRGILLDIEGTTSSVSFIYDVMFPFVRRELRAYLSSIWGAESLSDACELIARDAGYESFVAWSADAVSDEERQQLVCDEIIRLMDGDIKATGLKRLQGLIWKAGFESGELRAHVYDDVPVALTAWNESGIDVRIYSSGSIAAQKLFFGHTIAGDLLPCFRGHYDTTTGPKKEAASYEAIAAAYGLGASEILFISDVVAELDAAKSAGLQTALCLRPGSAAVESPHGHDEITTLAEVKPRKA
jgi:enolase-phosphatase E1